MIFALMTSLATPGEATKHEENRQLFEGTTPPCQAGTYQLADGRYSRYFNSHWRVPHASKEAAANEEALAPFALPCMRHLREHRWRTCPEG